MTYEGDPTAGWPPYAYVPGGPWPHPTRGAPAHGPTPPITGDAWQESAAYRDGFRLFDAGYYWEAHEVWEGLWHAHGRRGPVADLLKALIKLAAAGVKVREGQPHGVSTHARRAAELLGIVGAETGPRFLGLDLDRCAERAASIAQHPPVDTTPREARVARVFAFDLTPGAERSH